LPLDVLKEVRQRLFDVFFLRSAWRRRLSRRACGRPFRIPVASTGQNIGQVGQNGGTKSASSLYYFDTAVEWAKVPIDQGDRGKTGIGTHVAAGARPPARQPLNRKT
jgi:hypothetical protein